MFKKHIIFILLVLLSLHLFSQEYADTLILNKLYDLLEKAESYRVKSFEKCLEYAQQAQSLAKENNKIKELAEATKTIGIAYYFKGNFNDAINYYNEAKDYYTAINDMIGVAKIYNNIGIIYQRWSEYDSAYNHYFKSLQIYENLNDTLGKAGALNNIGNIEILMKKYHGAIKHFEEAYDIFNVYDNKREQANALNNIGYVYEEMQEIDKALEYYKQSLIIRKKIIDNYGIGVSLNNIGVIYFKKKDYKTALSYLYKSLATREALEHLDGIVSTKSFIAVVYTKLQSYNKAIKEYNEALVLAEQGKLKDKILNIYQGLNNVYELIGNYKKAHHYLTKYIVLKDSIFNETRMAQIAEIEAKYEKQKNLKEIELLKYEKKLQESELKKQKLFRNILILTGLFTLIVGLLLFNRYRIILRTKKLLEEQNLTIKSQNEKIAEINKNLTDSIIYAKHLLNSVLPQKEYVQQIFNDFFILNKPKDIVSGDFYWLKKNKNKIILAVADCTGHGVPGAIMSMLGISFLNEIVGHKTKISSSDILNELREKVIETLHQTGKKKESKDGIDIALCIIDTETKTLEFSGAYSNAFLITNGELIELKGDKKPIGIFITKQTGFNTQTIVINDGESLYLSSDGFFHQFGGKDNTKFSSSSFKELLLNNYKLPFNKQLKNIEQTFNNWKANQEQVDDILVFGAKIFIKTTNKN